MPSVRELIEYLTPAGTRPDPNRSGAKEDPWARPVADPTQDPWGQFPLWPPDLFAIAATLVSQSECYAHSRYSDTRLFDQRSHEHLAKLAENFKAPFLPDELLKMAPAEILEGFKKWDATLNDPDSELTKWWKVLVNTSGGVLIDAPVSRGGAPPEWWDAAMQLMVLADEACIAIGFLSPTTQRFVNANFAFDRYREYVEMKSRKVAWPGGPTRIQFPTSLCSVVPACKVSVQPKTHTVQVGCTINSLSHHVSLLPPHSQIRSEWRWGLKKADIPDTERIFEKALSEFRILIVPFPYRIDNDAFVPGNKCSPDIYDPAHFFGMKPTWLNGADGQPISAERLVDDLLLPLVKAAKSNGRSPDWLVLPELALTPSLARATAKRLAETTNLQLFVVGIGSDNDEFGFARNEVFGAVFGNCESEGTTKRTVVDSWRQGKHHRWKLEKNQIKKYGLTDVLDENKHWWEGIELYNRRCVFWVFEGLASLATLVCEDLARIHPVQPVLRAVGANLVMALLMDDEQETYRWSTRYATVLAEDPGSSVLAITSLGLIHRALVVDRSLPKKKRSRQDQTGFKIAVWREAPAMPGDHEDTKPKGLRKDDWEQLRSSRALPLHVDKGHHALLLTVGGIRSQAFSLVGLTDQGMTIRLRLMGKKSIRHPNSPAWAKYPF